MAAYRFKIPTWSQVAEGGLFSLNGAMALFCGLMAVLFGLFLAIFLVGSIIVQLGLAPDGNCSWNWGKPGAATTAHAEARLTQTPATVTNTTCETINGGKLACKTATRPMRPEDVKPDLVRDVLNWLYIPICTVPLAALVFGLAQASACFVGLARGRYFERTTVRQLRNFALGGLIFMLVFPNVNAIGDSIVGGVDMIVNALEPKGVSVHHATGRTSFDIAGFAAALPVIYALTLSVIAWVMAKAAAIAEDHAQIV
jgi:hypothetical protein